MILLNNIQERVERSIFEAIRKNLVLFGYLPNIENYPLTPQGQILFETAFNTINQTLGFSIELFGHGNSQSKGIKKVPRIVIVPRRVLPGDIGTSGLAYYQRDGLDPDNYVKINPPYETSTFNIDIHLISSQAKQDRVLHSILNASIGGRNYIPLYDNPNDRFFIRQYNYYDIPDTAEGLEEKVYSYEVTDLYLSDGSKEALLISPIKDITLDIS